MVKKITLNGLEKVLSSKEMKNVKGGSCAVIGVCVSSGEYTNNTCNDDAECYMYSLGEWCACING